MTNNSILSASQIRYLLALKRLHTHEGIRSVDIAKELQLTKASVHNMMDLFLELSYIRKEPNRAVYMTEYGMARASYYECYFQKLKERLFSHGNMDHTVDMGIYALLAELSDQALTMLV